MNPNPSVADTSGAPRQGPRLPPGQILTDKWPVLHYGPVPQVDLAAWDFRVFGLVERPQRWTREQFLALPRVQVRSDVHCVTRWSRYDNRWEGVAFREVLREAGVKPEARFAIASSTMEKISPPSMDGRCAWWFPGATSGRAPSGSGGSSSSTRTARGSGSGTATTTRPIPGKKSATPTGSRRGPGSSIRPAAHVARRARRVEAR